MRVQRRCARLHGNRDLVADPSYYNRRSILEFIMMSVTTEPRPQDALNDESRQFALLVNSVTDYAIYMLDAQGVIRTWNPGGQRIKGYLPAEVIGTNFARFYLPEDIAAGVPERNLSTAASEGRCASDGWRVRQDGSRFLASIVIDPIFVDGELIGFAKVTRDITERHVAQERLQQAQQSLLQAQKRRPSAS